MHLLHVEIIQIEFNIRTFPPKLENVNCKCAILEDFTAMMIQIVFFWVPMPRRYMLGYQYFG